MRSLMSAACALALLTAVAACSKSGDEAAGAPPAPAAGEAAGEAAMDEASAAGESKSAARRLPVDKFTYANYNEVRVTHLALDLTVDFDSQTLDGAAVLDVDRIDPAASTLVLDTNDLEVAAVQALNGGAWTPVDYTLGADDPTLGSKLEITLPGGVNTVRIAYRTSPGAAGLQWLTPEQTAGKKYPFMYSQNQAINARSMAPLQDTPAVRITYEATIRTPENLVAIMSAAQDDGPRDGDYHFEMPQPIPSYLLAIAAGDIAFKAIDDQVGVYSEQYILDDAAREFEDTPKMVEATANLYGPYRWTRYDMLILPPSFPFGGMENPRLSFLTPTIVAGDKSLTNTVAHELAHSWSGNLVTNATWRDPWLNEGVTSYVENRVIEKLYGRDRAVMEQALALAELKRDIAEAARPELTQLKAPADLDHPDTAFSQVPYVKGQFFLMFLEERFGRDMLDDYLRGYFDHFAFQSITTEDFEAYLEANLLAKKPGAVSADEIHEWLYEPGLPETAAKPVSDAFEKVAAQEKSFLDGDIAAGDIKTEAWSSHEWIYFINELPDDLADDKMAALDEAFSFSGSDNAEIAGAWYLQAIASGYEPAKPALKAFLLKVGRGRFIYRIYDSLIKNDQRDFAEAVYAEARPGYHPIAQHRIDEILG